MLFRSVDAMQKMTKDMSDADMTAISKQYAALESKPSDESVDPELVKRGAALAVSMRCKSCHLPSLAGREQMPRLARQRIDYLIRSMKEFRDSKRPGADSIMGASIAEVSDSDIEALAHYAASLR